MDNQPMLLSVRSVAQLLDCSQATVKRWVYEGSMPSVKIGALRRIPWDVLEEWIAERPREPRDERGQATDG